MIIYDKEQIVNWLTEISLRPCDFSRPEDYDDNMTEDLANGALEMLKEQEAIAPVRDDYDDFHCGQCGIRISRAIKIYDGDRYDTTHPDHLKPNSKCNFCKNCGRAVKWSE